MKKIALMILAAGLAVTVAPTAASADGIPGTGYAPAPPSRPGCVEHFSYGHPYWVCRLQYVVPRPVR